MPTTLERSTRHEPHYDYHGELKRAIAIADHYGFRLVAPPRIEKEDRDHAEKHGCPQEHAAFVRMMLHDDRFKGGETQLFAHTRKIPYKNKLALCLEVLGDRESSAEALLLQATTTILKEYGHKDVMVALNSVGGRESVTSFSQSMHAFVRPRLAELHPECRDGIRASIFAPLRCDHEACITALEEAPQSLNFLTEQSKQHFKEVLEYLESFDVPYVIEPRLVGNEHYTTRTVFQVGVPATGDGATGSFSQILAWGERYDQLAKKTGSKKTFPAVHVTLDLGLKTTDERFEPLAKSPAAPRVYAIHIGLPARMRALLVNESLRKARIRVSITLHKQSVTDQMEHAQKLGVPLLLIIGQKEVHDGTALVRHIATNRQNVVPWPDLPEYLKKMTADRHAKA